MSNPPLRREDAVYRYTFTLKSGETKWEQMKYEDGYLYKRLDNTVKFSNKDSFSLPSDIDGDFNMVARVQQGNVDPATGKSENETKVVAAEIDFSTNTNTLG